MAAAAQAGRVKTEISDERADYELGEMIGKCPDELEELARICELARDRKFDAEFCRRYGIHSANARRVFESAREFASLVSPSEKSDKCAEAGAEAEAAKSVLSAFSDRVCARLNEGTLACDVSGGRRAEVRRQSKKYASKIFVALELDEQNAGGRAVIMASGIVPVKKEWLKEMFAADFSETEEVGLDPDTKRVVAQKSVKFRDLVLERTTGAPASPDAAAKIFCDMIFGGKLALKNWSEAEDNFIERVNFTAEICPESGIAKIDEEAKRMIFEQMCLEKKTFRKSETPTFCRF